MANQFYTYLHCKPDGTPFYVGKGHDSKSYRRSHKLAGRNKFHKHIVNKYGRENILIYVFPCESEEQAFADEIHQISQLRLDGYILCNSTAGGEGAKGFIHPEQSRKKMSIFRTGKKQSEETKKRKSESLKLAFADSKIKMNNAIHLRNLKKNPEVEERRKKSLISSWADPEKKSIRVRKMNEKSNFNRKKILCIETGIEFNSIKLAVDWLHKNGFIKAKTSSISVVCNKYSHKNTAYGYHWRFA